MARYTKAMAVKAFEMLAKAMGKSVAAHCNDHGAWALDHNSTYGGYVIEQICMNSSAITHPFGAERKSAKDFYECCWFAIRALDIYSGEIQ